MKAKTKNYQVVVGNIGTVHTGTDYTEAITEFQTWGGTSWLALWASHRRECRHL